ncbi:MAG: VWA domain-containing protein, partial [Verrucomicrobia bacterium]|nr:VWA domain-containing protein [Verrucomicrobiota bacterium]
FAQPAWLWLLCAVPALLFLRGREGNAPAVTYSSTAILHAIGRPRAARAGRFRGALLGATLCAGIVALARPQLANSFTQIEASGIDIMICIDVSRSMLTEDYTLAGQRANRVDAVKEITQKFIEQRPNDRIGLLAFAGRPYLVSPLTLDHAWLIQNLDRIRIGLVEDGTAIGSALASAANRLKNREATSKSRIIVLLSDGENNSGRISPDTAAEAVRALGLKVYTIGAGTDGYAPYPFTDAFGRTVYRNIKADYSEKTLSEVAQIADGKFFRADSTAALQDIFATIDKLEKTTVQVSKYRQYRDLFSWPLGLGAALLALHTLLAQTLWRRLP